MAGTDFGDADLDKALAVHANAGVAGVADIPPDAAAQAIAQGPQVGIPPTVGMRTPDIVKAQAAQAQQQTVIANSPAIAQWAATAPPAHLATSQDDFSNLDKIAGSVTSWMQGVVGNPIQDWTMATAGLGQDVAAQANELWNGAAGGMTVDNQIAGVKAAGKLGLDLLTAVPSVALAPVTESLSRAFASGLTETQPILPWERARPLNSPEEKLAEGRRLVSLAFLGATSAAGSAKIGEVPPEAPAAAGSPKLLPGPAELREAQSQDDLAQVARIQDQIAASATHARSPEVAERFLEDQTQGAQVAVDSDKLIELAGQGHEPFPEAKQDIVQNALDGVPTQVPTSRYLSQTAGQSFAEELNSATTFRDAGVSADESKELGPDLEPEENMAGTPGVSSVPEPAVPADLTEEEAPRYRTLAAEHDAAVDQVVQALRLNSVFANGEARITKSGKAVSGESPLGMTKPEFERYNNQLEEVIAKARETMTKRAYSQILRERKPDWQAAQARQEVAVKSEQDSMPVVNAMRQLSQTGFKLDRDLTENFFPGSYARLPKTIMKQKGNHPDEAAEILGYSSAAQMTSDLADLQDTINASGAKGLNAYLAKAAKTEAAARTAKELGFDLSKDAILDAASDAINVPSMTSFLSSEVQQLAQLAHMPFKPKTIEAYAQVRFEQGSVKSALDIVKRQSYVYKLGLKTEDALAKGDFATAFIRKQQQFIQHLQLVQAHKFQKTFTKGMAQIAHIAAKPIALSMAQEARNYQRLIVARLGLHVKTGKFENVTAALQGKSLDTYLKELTANGTPVVQADLPLFPPITATGKFDTTALSVDQFSGINDMLTSIGALGKEQMKVTRAGEAQALSEVVSQIKANADELGRTLTAGERRLALERMFKGDVSGAVRDLGASVVRPEVWLNWMDQEKAGPLMKFVVEPLQKGKFWKSDRETQLSKAWHEFAKAQPKGWEKGLDLKVDVPELLYSVDRDGQPVQWLTRKSQVIMMATHFGTESNFNKLTSGYNWNPDAVRAVANRVLTKADWDYVQFILDQHAALLPEIQKLYRATVGLAMDSIPATPIETPFGTLKGGYRHVDYDWNSVGEFKDQNGNMVNVKDPNALGESAMFGKGFRVSTPPNRHTLARTQFSAPMNLSHASLWQEFDGILHDIAFRQPLIQAAKIMGQPAVREAFRDVLGPEYLHSTEKWLTDVARQGNYDQGQLAWAAQMIRGLRKRFTTYQIGYNLATMVKHGGIAALHINGEVGAANFMRAVGKMAANSPEESKRWSDFVDENSGEVRNALLNLDRDVRELIAADFKKHGFVESYKYQAFTMFGWVKQFEARGTWLAKYEILSKQGMPHADAVLLADKAVRDTQGAGNPIDLPQMYRGGSSFWEQVGKLSNVFTNFENTAANRLWTAQRIGQRRLNGFADKGWAGGTRDFARIMNASFSFVILTAIFATVFDLAITGNKNSWKHFFSYGFENIAKSALGGSLPFGSLIADAPRLLASRDHTPNSDSVIDSVIKDVLTTGTDAYHAIRGETSKVSKNWVEHAIATVGYSTGLPLKPGAKGGQYIWNISHNLEHSNSPADFIRGAIFGPKQRTK